MKHLDDTVERLTNNDPQEAITVINLDNSSTVERLICNMTATMFNEEYGGIHAYFNGLFDKGYKNLRIVPKRKNGSQYMAHPRINPYDICMSEEEESSAEPKAEAKTVQKTEPAKETLPLLFVPGLNGPDSPVPTGLGVVQAGMLWDYQRLHRENEKKDAKIEKLELANKDLEKKVNEYEINEGKTERTDLARAKLLESGAAYSGVLEKLAGIFVDKIAPQPAQVIPGLGMPELSAVQQDVFQYIQNFDDETLKMFKAIFDHIENQAFGNDLVELMKKHLIISAA